MGVLLLTCTINGAPIFRSTKMPRSHGKDNSPRRGRWPKSERWADSIIITNAVPRNALLLLSGHVLAVSSEHSAIRCLHWPCGSTPPTTPSFLGKLDRYTGWLQNALFEFFVGTDLTRPMRIEVRDVHASAPATGTINRNFRVLASTGRSGTGKTSN